VFGQVFSKNHLTQTQPNPNWKLIGSGLGRQFDDWVVVLAPKKVPEPLKSPKIAGSIQPNPTQPNPNPKCLKTGLGLGSKSWDLTQPNKKLGWVWARFFSPNPTCLHPDFILYLFTNSQHFDLVL
jgi:hypothetical protein